MDFAAYNSFEIFISVIILVFGALVLNFVSSYVKNALRIGSELKKIRESIRGLDGSRASLSKSAIKDIFGSGRLSHYWSEYQETLHDQFTDQDGEFVLARSRATQPAALIFNHQNVIETPLSIEFYKHLPGILTGMGILATFAGLMHGLDSFDVSDPATIDRSVQVLLEGVKHAFILSAIAIGTAVVITIIEKWLFHRCIAFLDEITQQIDQRFDSGVGEEYLSSLVDSSRENAVQARMLKDGLVNDLKAMLENLIQEQAKQNIQLSQNIADSHHQSSQMMADRISESVEKSLKGPLEKIADSVQSVSGDQSSQVKGLLEDLLLGFMSKLDNTFGQQFVGLSEMMAKSVQAIEQMQAGFSSLIDAMQSSTTESANTIQAKLAEVLAEMNSHQSQLQESMMAMVKALEHSVESIGEKGADAATAMAEEIKKMLEASALRQAEMENQSKVFAETLQETIKRLNEESHKQNVDAQQRIHDGAARIIGDLSAPIAELLEGMKEERRFTKETIDALGAQTQKNIKEMESGAIKMSAAADKFTDAGDAMSDLAYGFEDSLKNAQQASAEISKALAALSSMLADIRQQREAAEKLHLMIQAAVSSAVEDASQRKQLISDLKTVTSEIKSANNEAAEYLQKINKVLTQNFTDFGDGVAKSLEKVLGGVDKDLERALRQINSSFEELGENVQDLAETVEAAIHKG